MRTRYLALNILGTILFLCFAQGSTYAWFHSSDNCKNCPTFESPRSAEKVSKTYAFLPNAPDAASKIHLYRTFSKDSFPASAGELKVDIPFNLLSASVTNPQALLDRHIAANLRLKNLLEQYLALQKKNAEMLKNLSIPYLDTKERRKKAVPASDAEKLAPADGLKKKMAEVILFQTSDKNRLLVQDSHNFRLVTAGKKGKGDSVSALKKYEKLSSKEDYSKNMGRTGAYHKIYSRDAELPWIFSFGLGLMEYLTSNKIEILSWAAVMAVIGLVGTILVKR